MKTQRGNKNSEVNAILKGKRELIHVPPEVEEIITNLLKEGIYLNSEMHGRFFDPANCLCGKRNGLVNTYIEIVMKRQDEQDCSYQGEALNVPTAF